MLDLLDFDVDDIQQLCSPIFKMQLAIQQKMISKAHPASADGAAAAPLSQPGKIPDAATNSDDDSSRTAAASAAQLLQMVVMKKAQHEAASKAQPAAVIPAAATLSAVASIPPLTSSAESIFQEEALRKDGTVPKASESNIARPGPSMWLDLLLYQSRPEFPAQQGMLKRDDATIRIEARETVSPSPFPRTRARSNIPAVYDAQDRPPLTSWDKAIRQANIKRESQNKKPEVLVGVSQAERFKSVQGFSACDITSEPGVNMVKKRIQEARERDAVLAAEKAEWRSS